MTKVALATRGVPQATPNLAERAEKAPNECTSLGSTQHAIIAQNWDWDETLEGLTVLMEIVREDGCAHGSRQSTLRQICFHKLRQSTMRRCVCATCLLRCGLAPTCTRLARDAVATASRSDGPARVAICAEFVCAAISRAVPRRRAGPTFS